MLNLPDSSQKIDPQITQITQIRLKHWPVWGDPPSFNLNLCNRRNLRINLLGTFGTIRRLSLRLNSATPHGTGD
jgi:hypothetical protein